MNEADDQFGLSRDEYVAVRAQRLGMTKDEFLGLQRQQVLRLARSVISGELGVVEGARSLSSLREAYATDSDPDLLVLIGVDTQTDHLAVGRERANWSAEALARQDADLHDAEDTFRAAVLDACRRIIARFIGGAVDGDQLR